MDLKQKILIIGGSGFLGSNLSNYLSEKYDVTSVSRNREKEFKKSLSIRYEYFDFEDYEETKAFFKNEYFDYILNCSGYVNHSSFVDDGDKIFNNQFKIIYNILVNTIIKKPIKLVQIGSSDEYGYSTCELKEDVRERPISPYSLGKLASTHLCMIFSKEYAYPLNVVRPFLIYGPNQNKKRLIPYVINACLKNEQFKIGNKTLERDFLYIDDFNNFILEILKNKSVDGEIFNIGSGEATSLEDLTKKIIFLIKKGKPIFDKYDSNKFEKKKLVANLDKVHTSLCWRQKTSLEEGLKKTIDFLKNNK